MFHDEVQSKPYTLSTSIEQFYQQSGSGSLAPHQRSLVKDLKLEYNKIIDQHYHDDSLVYPDPLEPGVLPPEIGLMILHEALISV